jgi:hypothetical protein
MRRFHTDLLQAEPIHQFGRGGPLGRIRMERRGDQVPQRWLQVCTVGGAGRGERLVRADSSCMVAFGWYDITEVALQPYPPDLYAVASLAPMPSDVPELLEENGTLWRLHDLNLARIGGEPVPPEDWDSVDLEATLEMACDESEESA